VGLNTTGTNVVLFNGWMACSVIYTRPGHALLSVASACNHDLPSDMACQAQQVANFVTTCPVCVQRLPVVQYCHSTRLHSALP